MPGRYRTRMYAVNVPLPSPNPPNPVPAGTTNTASVTIQNFPFLMKRIGHSVNGPNNIAAGPLTLAAVAQDGQYTIRVRTDDKNYMNIPVNATAAFGGGQFSTILDLPAPIEFQPKQTVTVEVTTTIPRVAGIEVQVVLQGVEPDDLPVPTEAG